MRNLKKILALVLAMIMAFSVMATANAAIADLDSVDPTYDEAVEVLTGLGVFKGRTTGDDNTYFAPQSAITRAEVAAIIYRIATGDVEGEQEGIYADYNKFTDVDSNAWYAGYVNFCANAEYVLGYAGKFNPDANVTGYQALAMILRAIGYDVNGEFTGSDWQVQTAAVGKKLGITDNVTAGTLGTAATREVVAEILFQTIANAPRVEYTLAFGYQPVTLKKDEIETLGEKMFGLKKVEGIVVANEKVDLDAPTKRLAAGKTELDNGVTYTLTTNESHLGEKIAVWVNEDKVALNTPAIKSTSKDYSNQVLTAKVVADNLAGVPTYYNYAPVTGNAGDYDGLGVTIKAINNDKDSAYDVVFVVEEDMATVKYISTKGTITLDTMNSASTQDAEAGIAVDDVVLVNTYGGVTHITLADYVTGIVEGYNKKADPAVATIAGADYSESVLENKSSELTSFTDVTNTYEPWANWNGTTYNYYQDTYGNIVAYAKASELDTGYALILDYDVYKTGAFQGDLTWRPTDGINAGDLYVKYLTEENEVQTAKVDADLAKYLGTQNITIEDGQIARNVELDEMLPGDVVEYNINENGEFVLAYSFDYVDANVYIDSELEVAHIDGEIYGVDEDLVVFYYTNLGMEIADGEYGFMELVNKFGLYTPAYGVLTGEAAMADLDENNYMATENLHQMDGVANEKDHLGQFGYVDMMNIRGNIDTFAGHAYVFADTGDQIGKKVDGKYVWIYEAVNAAGEPIEIFTNLPQAVDADTPVCVYRTINLNGETVSWLDHFVDVEKGDLHATSSDKQFYMFKEFDNQAQEGFLVTAPAVYADATSEEGGQVELHVDNCTTAYVVYDSDEAVRGRVAEAVFVVEDKDTDGQPLYIDTTLKIGNGDEMECHLRVGAKIELTAGCYELDIIVDGEDAEVVVHADDANDDGFVYITVARAWEDKKVTITDVSDTCEECILHELYRTGAIVKVADNNDPINCAENTTAYKKIADAKVAADKLNVGQANYLVVETLDDTWTVNYAVFTSTEAVSADDADKYNEITGNGIDVDELVDGNALVLKITRGGTGNFALDCYDSADAAHENCTTKTLYVVYEVEIDA